MFEQTVKHGLPIKFIGSIPREELFEWYTKAILIFPSCIETFGLPLLEAKMHGTPIIVADMLFVKEILSDFPCVHFYKFNEDINSLNNRLKSYIKRAS